MFIDSICLDGGVDFETTMANVTKDYMNAKESGGNGSWTGLYRHELDLTSGKVQRYRLSNRGCEFPCVNPKNTGVNYQYTYASASGNEGSWYMPHVGVNKIDVQNKGNDSVWLAPE
mgnify:CR=1 FL=1